MKRSLALALLACPLFCFSGGAKDSKPQTFSVQLSDQFDHQQSLAFPSSRPVVLAIGDRSGSAQVTEWVQPLKKAFAEQIEFRGLADVSSVPAPLRSLVRKKFQKIQSFPVMMDWSGKWIKHFQYEPGAAEILLLDRDGRITKRLRGPASPTGLSELEKALTDLLGMNSKAKSSQS